MSKYISYDEALAKLRHYCAYQERCHQEVREKLLDLGIYGDDLEQIICELIEENFLNELRFAQLYVGGKFRIKKWGKQKIIRQLKQKRVSKYCIKKAIESEINQEAYEASLYKLLEKKNRLLKDKNLYKRRQKLAQYAIRKGYESGLVWEFVKELIPNEN